MKTIWFSNTNQIPSTKTIISAAASAAATAMLIRTITRDYMPRELRDYFFTKVRTFIASISSELTLVIEEYDGLTHNHLYKAVKLYLEPTIPPYTKRIKVTLPKNETKFSLSVGKNEEIIDNFNGVNLRWRYVSKQIPSKVLPGPDHFHPVYKSDLKHFELSFHKKHKDMVLASYLEHVLEKSKELKEKKKSIRIFTLRSDRMSGRRGEAWQSVRLDHPSTFDTLAIDIEVKKMIMEDLQRFLKRKEYYRKVGKAWKRGYLLFGPPGTGKSSLIAAMANYLNFDVYDLELSDIKGNSELRKLLITTGNKSILVVEDIDCSMELQDRIAQTRASANSHRHPYSGYTGNQVTLSGLLNYIDGLWSSCGDERIIVFTTNHKEKLDPALLRPGRMDMHIHMSYCTPCGFKMLASNYLNLTDHPLFSEIEEMLVVTKLTPAEIGEQLMKDGSPDIALRSLIEFIENKKRELETKAIEDEVINEKEKEAKMEENIEHKDE